MLKQTLLASFIGSTLLLSACGGGGGGGSSASSIADVKISFKKDLPSSASVSEGDELKLSVTVETTRPASLTFEWYFNNQKVNVPSNTTTLVVSDITVAQEGSYRVVVKETFRENNLIQSKSTQVKVQRKQIKPSFEQKAATFAAIIGDNITLDPIAIGFPTPTYQWYKNGIALAGQTKETLEINRAKKTDSGLYYVVAKNALGESKSPEYQVNIALQLATGAWVGTLGNRNAVFVVAPNGQFIFNALSDTEGLVSATGEVRTTSALQSGAQIKFHPQAEVSALISDASGKFFDGDTTLSFNAGGIAFTPRSTITSSLVQLNKPIQATSSLTVPKYEFSTLNLQYDQLISDLITTPADLTGTWKSTQNNIPVNSIQITAQGGLTGTLFEGSCEIRNGKVLAAEDSKAFYTVEYALVQPAGKNCPIALSNPIFKGLALRIPDTNTGAMSLFMTSYFVSDNRVVAVQPLFLSR